MRVLDIRKSRQGFPRRLVRCVFTWRCAASICNRTRCLILFGRTPQSGGGCVASLSGQRSPILTKYDGDDADQASAVVLVGKSIARRRFGMGTTDPDDCEIVIYRGANPCAYRKSHPAILMVQSAQDRTIDNASRVFGGARYRRVLVQ